MTDLPIKTDAAEPTPRKRKVPRFNVEREGNFCRVNLETTKEGQDRFLAAFGTAAPEFAEQAALQLSRMVADPATGHPDADGINAALAAVAAFQATDELEAMMAVQATALHLTTLECLRRAHVPGQDPGMRIANLGAANKCSRTFATVVETLNRHRGKGQQSVEVRHVTVNEGGQAMVGAFQHGGRGDGGKTGR